MKIILISEKKDNKKKQLETIIGVPICFFFFASSSSFFVGESWHFVCALRPPSSFGGRSKVPKSSSKRSIHAISDEFNGWYEHIGIVNSISLNRSVVIIVVCACVFFVFRKLKISIGKYLYSRRWLFLLCEIDSQLALFRSHDIVEIDRKNCA